ncbi:MAG: RHS repeat-associated core domain-containing protein [Deltaproteobacteria bacterium]
MGTVLGVVNTSGAEIARYVSDDFGNPQVVVGGSPNPFRFAGAFLDSETGLVQMRGRYYDPSFGRFLTQDVNPGNPYSYCRNNPASLSDPSGWGSNPFPWLAVQEGYEETNLTLLKYLCGPATDAYNYIMSFANDKKIWELINLINSPTSGEQIARIAEFFEGANISTWKATHPGVGAFPCTDFVNLVLRLSGAVSANFNPSPTEAYNEYSKLFEKMGQQAIDVRGALYIVYRPGPSEVLVLHAGFFVDDFQIIGVDPLTGNSISRQGWTIIWKALAPWVP